MSWLDDDRDESPTVLRHHPGERLYNRFVLEREIAGGGMGVVWLALDQELNRRIALKFLPDRIRNDATAIENLKHEALKSIELAHPNIVRIYDFVHDPQSAAISMEFVDGETLASLRKAQTHKVFEVADIRPRIRQLCAALEYAHEVGEVVHRDLKPSNLMVNRRGQLKVTDFGIASSLAVGKSQRETGGGTPGYMSPQQAARQPASVLDDVYSMGATIYDLLTGRPPLFDEERKQVVAHMQDTHLIGMEERRRLLRVVCEPIPRQWEDTVAACLSFNPADRPQSIREVSELLGLLESTTRPLLQAPETPVGLKARAGNQRVSLSWASSSGATSYTIKRSLQAGGPHAVVSTVNEGTDYSDTTVENGRTYFYIVEAVNAAGASPPSSEAKGEPQAPPGAPTNLRSKVSDRLIAIEWDPVPGINSYSIKRANKSGGPYGVIATVSATTRFQDTGVDNGVTYHYVVESINPAGLSAPSMELRAMPCPLPLAPLGLTLAVADRVARLSWRGVPDAVAYRVLRSEVSGGPYRQLATIEELTRYEDPTVENNQRYFYVLESLNSAGISPHSAEVSGTPMPVPAAPMAIKLEVGDGQVLLSWASASHANGYTVHRAMSAQGPFEQIALVNAGTSYLDAPLENGQDYFYCLAAFNGSGSGVMSKVMSATPPGIVAKKPSAPLIGPALIKMVSLSIVVLALAMGAWVIWKKNAVQEGISVASEPAGATVMVNGQTVGKTPLKTQLSPSHYQVQLALDGYESTEQGVDVESGKVKQLSLPLTRSKGEVFIAPRQQGRYAFKIRDGKGMLVKSDTTEPAGSLIDLETGKYSVEIDNPGWPLQVETVVVERKGRAKVSPDFEPATVDITSDPSGAEITVEGKLLGNTPLVRISMPPGERQAKARFPGLADRDEKLVVRRGVENRQNFKFDYGRVHITSVPPGASVTVRGTNEPVGRTPYTSPPIPSGPASYFLLLTGFERQPVPVTVNSGTVVTQSVSLIKVTTPRGSLFVDASPSGATVLLNNEPYGKTGTRIEGINPGRYRLQLELEGYDPSVPVDVDVSPNGLTRIDRVELVASKGKVQVISDPPQLEFTIHDSSGKEVVKGVSGESVDLPIGKYQLVVEKKYWEMSRKITNEVVVKRNATVRGEVVIPTGSVAVTSDPADVQILWQKQVRLARAPATIELPAGDNVLMARHPVLGEKPLEVRVEAGKTAAADFKFDYGAIELTSTPAGAEVVEVDAAGRERSVGVTPWRADMVRAGTVNYVVRQQGYRPKRISGTVEARSRRPLSLEAALERAVGRLKLVTAQQGVEINVGGVLKTSDPLVKDLPAGMHNFTLSLANHEVLQTNVMILDGQVTELAATLVRSTGMLMVDSIPPGATFSLQNSRELNQPIQGTTPRVVRGLPTGEYHVLVEKGPWKVPVFTVMVERNKTNSVRSPLPYSTVKIATTPVSGATIQINGVKLDGVLTPGVLDVPVGDMAVVVAMRRYRPLATNVSVRAQEPVQLNLAMREAYGPQPGEPWTNSLGLVFVPMGDHHICVTETRVRDFIAYRGVSEQKGSEPWQNPEFQQTTADPVVNVNWSEAKAFCEWLTRVERLHQDTSRRIEEQFYRLPTDEEWDMASGAAESMFPWGSSWPPPPNAANLYEMLTFDGYDRTAPVGIFTPNKLGIHDLAGNVREWCEQPGGKAIVRGGSWIDSAADGLRSDYREARPPGERQPYVGFRLVVDRGARR